MRYHLRPVAIILTAALSVTIPEAMSQTQAQTQAQTQSSSSLSPITAIPSLIRFSAVLSGETGRPGRASLTFLIFADEKAGEPLWMETQEVAVDASGRYEVNLGSATSAGLPADLFSSPSPRWLEVQPAGQPAEPRRLLTSVPYALKAADANTLGGLPVSAFALAGSIAASNASLTRITPEASATSVTTAGGAAGYLPVFSTASAIKDSVAFQLGSTLGINTKTPATTLDVNGSITARGALALQSSGTATTSAGKNSQPLNFFASAYDSATLKATAPQFTFQAQPAANNTSSPGATLNLLYGNGATPAQTGFSINSKGILTFAPGQTFPAVSFTGTSTSGVGVSGTSTSGNGVDGVSSTANGVFGTTAGTKLNTAGVLGRAGAVSGFGGIAGVWGDAFAHVGVLGTSYQQAGVEGVSQVGAGVLGQSEAGFGLQGISTTGYGVSGVSSTSNGVFGSTGGNTLYTAGVLGAAGARTSFQGIAAVWGDSATQTGVLGSSNTYMGLFGNSVSGAGVYGASTSGNGMHGVSQGTSGIFGETSSTSSQDAALFGYSHANAVGVYGYSGPNNGVHGVSQSTSGMLAETSSTSSLDAGLYGYSHAAAMGVYGASYGGLGIVGYSRTSTGVTGTSGGSGNGVTGSASTGYGVFGTSSTGAGGVFENSSTQIAALVGVNSAGWAGGYNPFPAGVYGTSGAYGTVGVEGQSAGANGGAGVYGVGGASIFGIKPQWGGRILGVWGDTTGEAVEGQAIAVLGTAADSNAGYFQNNSASNSSIYAYNYDSGGTGVDAVTANDALTAPRSGNLFKSFAAATPTGVCGFGDNGNLLCSGQIKALATTASGGRTVETYSMQSPENWMEDFGSGSLHHGTASVAIESAFAETISGSADYHVFLTPNGDCKGLYVTRKTATSFEVRELGGGSSSIAFEYRIVAKRRGYESQRMTDVTDAFQTEKARLDTRTKSAAAAYSQRQKSPLPQLVPQQLPQSAARPVSSATSKP